MRRGVFIAALALAGALLGPPFAAAEDAAAPWSEELIQDLMSPYCPGRTLRNCPSPAAGDLIHWIQAQEAEGRERDAVYDQLLVEFGEEIRQAPPASGFGAVAYAIPVVAFLAGGAVVALFLRRQGQAQAKPPAPRPVATGDSELERLVDEELDRSA